jgi:hypothetical protein
VFGPLYPIQTGEFGKLKPPEGPTLRWPSKSILKSSLPVLLMTAKTSLGCEAVNCLIITAGVAADEAIGI